MQVFPLLLAIVWGGWFSADPESGVETGGRWDVRPAVAEGGYRLSGRHAFVADADTNRPVRVESRLAVTGGFDVRELTADIPELRRMPAGALTVGRDESGLHWYGLVGDESGVRWIPLRGSVPEAGRTYRIVCECAVSGEAPYIAYSVAADGEEPSALADDEGRTRFARAAETDALGSVEYGGSGTLLGLEAFAAKPRQRGRGFMIIVGGGGTDTNRLARLEEDGNIVRFFGRGMPLFSTRDFTMDGVQPQLEGLPYLVDAFAPEDSNRTAVVRSGWLSVLARNRTAVAREMEAQGFVRDTSVPATNTWGAYTEDKGVVWRKWCARGERVRLGQWGVLFGFDPQGFIRQPRSPRNLALFGDLCVRYGDATALAMSATVPDYAVYVPGANRLSDEQGNHDAYNDHFHVMRDGARGTMYAFWTQATAESLPDHHVMFSRSSDGGTTWSEAVMLAGSVSTNASERQVKQGASWQQAMLSRSGRLYLLWSRDFDHRMGGRYSDDGGATWSNEDVVDFDPRTPREVAAGSGRASWWCNWQRPLRLGPDGHYLVGSSRGEDGLEFWEYLNIDENPAIRDVSIAMHCRGDAALFAPDAGDGNRTCEEASIMKLPDGRLFAVMRAGGGTPVWSVSSDQGVTWAAPERLRTRDGGELIAHPISPCPCYDWKGCEAGSGRYFGVFHFANDSKRPPLFLVPGTYDPNARQPVDFSGRRKPFMPHNQFNSMYSSYSYDPETDTGTLWYNDRAKYYLLGREIDDTFMEY